MSNSTRPRRWLASRRRPAAVVPALTLIVATLAIATAARPVPLAEVLLVVLVEVVAVSLVAGRATAAVTAVATSVAVNWLLVPPYGTLVVAEEQNWITLGVFLLLAVGVSSLVESVVTAERNSAAAAAREAAVAQALRPAGTSAAEALAVLRAALLLEVAALVDASTGEVMLSGAQHQPTEPPTLEVLISPHFQVIGWGPPVLGSRPEYVRTLATATVRGVGVPAAGRRTAALRRARRRGHRPRRAAGQHRPRPAHATGGDPGLGRCPGHGRGAF